MYFDGFNITFKMNDGSIINKNSANIAGKEINLYAPDGLCHDSQVTYAVRATSDENGQWIWTYQNEAIDNDFITAMSFSP